VGKFCSLQNCIKLPLSFLPTKKKGAKEKVAPQLPEGLVAQAPQGLSY
jgi:hypothetical protein